MSIFGKTKDIKQAPKEEPGYQLYMMQLLFEKTPVKPAAEVIFEALKKRFGEVDVSTNNEVLTSFIIKKYKIAIKDGIVSPLVFMKDVDMFKADEIGQIERSQLWNVKDGEDILKQCPYSVTISDMMTFVLEYKQRCELLMDWLEVAVGLFPECKAVWMKPAGKLFTADQIRNHNIQREDRFIYFGVNARLFNIQETNDKVVDTLGLHTIGLPDVQFHFHNIEPNAVVKHAYNVASYIFDNNAPIKNDETIDGIMNGQLSMEVRWECHYEMSLIEP